MSRGNADSAGSSVEAGSKERNFVAETSAARVGNDISKTFSSDRAVFEVIATIVVTVK